MLPHDYTKCRSMVRQQQGRKRCHAMLSDQNANSCARALSAGVGGWGLTWLHAPRMMADTSEIVLVVCSRDQVGIR